MGSIILLIICIIILSCNKNTVKYTISIIDEPKPVDNNNKIIVTKKEMLGDDWWV